MRSACKIFVCQPEGKIPLRRSRCAWADSIRMDLKIGWKDVDWIHLAQYWVQWRNLVNTIVNLWILQNVGIFFTNFSRTLILGTN